MYKTTRSCVSGLQEEEIAYTEDYMILLLALSGLPRGKKRPTTPHNNQQWFADEWVVGGGGNPSWTTPVCASIYALCTVGP